MDSDQEPIPIPPLPFEGARTQRERITKQDTDEYRDAPVATQSKTTKGRKLIQIVAEHQFKNVSE